MKILKTLEKQALYLLQALMGIGKTKVILPYLMAAKAEQNVSCLIVPQSLYDTVFKDLSSRCSKAFNKVLHGLCIRRDTLDTSSSGLQGLYEWLQGCQERKECLIFTKADILSLWLTYYELIASYPSAQGEASQNAAVVETERRRASIEWLGAILSLLLTKGVATIDEGDNILNYNKEVNYASGAKVSLKNAYGNPVEWTLLMYKLVFESHPELLHKIAHQPILGKELDSLKETLFLLIQEQIDAFSNLDPKKLLSSLEVNAAETFKNYVIGKTDTLAEIGQKLFPEITTLGNSLKRLIDSMCGALAQEVNVSYGVRGKGSPAPGEQEESLKDPHQIIPYLQSQPIVGSIFSDPFTELNLIACYYSTQTIPLELFRKFIVSYRNKYVGAFMDTNFTQRKECQVLLEAFSQDRDVLKLFKLLTPEENSCLVDTLYQKYCEEKSFSENQLLRRLIIEFLAEGIFFYPHSFIGQSHLLLMGFKEMRAFSGTMETFRDSTYPGIPCNAPQMGEGYDQVKAKLKSDSPSIDELTRLDHSELKLKLQALIKSSQEVCAFLDEGALYKNISTSEILEWIQDALNKEQYKWIIYFENHTLFARNIKNNTVKELGSSDLNSLKQT